MFCYQEIVFCGSFVFDNFLNFLKNRNVAGIIFSRIFLGPNGPQGGKIQSFVQLKYEKHAIASASEMLLRP